MEAAANEQQQQQQAEAGAEELRVQFEDLMTARGPKAPKTSRGPLWQYREERFSLQKEARKSLNTPAGREVLFETTNQQPIHALLPRSVRLDLMLSEETRELRRSARDLRALLSPDSPALSLVVPPRERMTVAEYKLELQQIHELVMATCKHSLRTVHLDWSTYAGFNHTDEEFFTAEHETAVRHFLHGLLTSLQEVTALKVRYLDDLVTDQTLSLLGSSQKNLRCLGVKNFAEVAFTAAGVAALSSGCTQLEALEVRTHDEDPPPLSPDVVASALQDLPSLKILDIEDASKVGGMVLYASNPANPPHGLQWGYLILRHEQQHVWGGENLEPLVTAFPNVHKLDMWPVTDAYSDVVASNVHSLAHVELGTSRWSLGAQARFFSEFTGLTCIDLIPLDNLAVDLGVIGKNCLALKTLCVYDATFTGREVKPVYFQQLESLYLTASWVEPARLPDSFLKLLLSGPRLGSVYLQNFEVADHLMLELCQEEQASQQGEQHGAFSQLRSLRVTGQGWPGLCASTVVRLACQAPNLDTLELSVRQWGGGEAPVRDGLVLSTFFKNHMGSVRYLPVE